MKQIAVLSGKGGSGKTFLSSSLAVLMKDAVLADCDVDAANLHLMLSPEQTRCTDFVSGTAAVVDASRCTGCGACVEACRFHAIEVVGPTDSEHAADARAAGSPAGSPPGERPRGGYAVVDPIACEGCGVCDHLCPEDAVTLVEQRRGTWCVSHTDFGPLVHAHLEPGEENSGKLVERVRREAVESARHADAAWILIDGPPGTGCAAKSAMTGVDFLVMVTEPTVSGIHDLERVLDLADHFGIPAGVVINKSGLSTRQTGRIEATIARRGAVAPLAAVGSQASSARPAIVRLGAIPFSPTVPEALTRLVPYPLAHADAITDELRSIWNAIVDSLE